MTLNEAYAFDLERIAEALDRHAVRYVTIGGASGMLHGVVDYLTRDVDVLIRDDQDNLARLAAALTELGAVSDGPITAADFTGNTQWETNAGPLDVLVVAIGPNETVLLYADIEPRTVFFQIGDGLSIPTAALDDVIRMKEAADRHKDHQALPELRRLRGDPHPEHPRGFDPFAGFALDDEGDDDRSDL